MPISTLMRLGLRRRSIRRGFVALAALVLLVGCGSTPNSDTAIRVVATEMAFTPQSLEVTQGEMVTIRLVNAGNVAHNLVLEMPSATRRISANNGVDALMTFPARDLGTFRFFCSIPGHEEMEGTLTISAP
jgi:plastocyanin